MNHFQSEGFFLRVKNYLFICLEIYAGIFVTSLLRVGKHLYMSFLFSLPRKIVSYNHSVISIRQPKTPQQSGRVSVQPLGFFMIDTVAM